ncbi:hypothetical protein EVAR_73899_1 [Eumeta japonica]|uniref:Uncharacterized protein n=1 Tax=Eumeta variegata TaxID=151549 RepID=A0A4C1TNZ2_EUMVA|nr:hypothetical protein EVAR_73899_1 [Eumeta japonica]
MQRKLRFTSENTPSAKKNKSGLFNRDPMVITDTADRPFDKDQKGKHKRSLRGQNKARSGSSSRVLQPFLMIAEGIVQVGEERRTANVNGPAAGYSKCSVTVPVENNQWKLEYLVQQSKEMVENMDDSDYTRIARKDYTKMETMLKMLRPHLLKRG